MFKVLGAKVGLTHNTLSNFEKFLKNRYRNFELKSLEKILIGKYGIYLNELLFLPCRNKK